jgi:hypothetical protein
MKESLSYPTFLRLEGPEAGVAHHYSDEHDARDLLSAFEVQSLDQIKSLTADDRIRSHWEFIATRADALCCR